MKSLVQTLVLLPLAALLFAGCGRSGHTDASEASPLADSVAAAVRVPAALRLDTALTPGSRSLAALLATVGLDTVTADAIARFRALPWQTAFAPEVARAFPAGWRGADTLALTAGRVGALLGLADGGVGEVATVVLPYRQSVIVDSADGVALVILNHYLGADHPAYAGFPDYERVRKAPWRMAPDLAEALVNVYRPGEPATVAAALLREGAVTELVMQACGIGEAEALGFTQEEYAWATAHERQMWDTLVTQRLLFSTRPDDARRLLAPAPFATLVAPDAPGRIGRFTGHRLARAWMEAHPGRPVTELLQLPKDTPNPLADIQYRP